MISKPVFLLAAGLVFGFGTRYVTACRCPPTLHPYKARTPKACTFSCGEG